MTEGGPNSKWFPERIAHACHITNGSLWVRGAQKMSQCSELIRTYIMRMCIYIYILYVYMYMYGYVYIYIYVCIYMYSICKNMCIYIYTCVYMCTFDHTHIHRMIH